MVVLIKIRGSALLEAIVSTVIIMGIMTVSTLVINSIYLASVKKNDDQFQTRIQQVSYFSIYGKLTLPFYEDTEQWTIEIDQKNRLKALNKVNDEEEIITLHNE